MLLLLIVTGNILIANEGLSGRQLHGVDDNVDRKQAIPKMMFRVLIKYIFVSLFALVFVSVLQFVSVLANKQFLRWRSVLSLRGGTSKSSQESENHSSTIS